MPTINVQRDLLFEALGKVYSKYHATVPVFCLSLYYVASFVPLSARSYRSHGSNDVLSSRVFRVTLVSFLLQLMKNLMNSALTLELSLTKWWVLMNSIPLLSCKLFVWTSHNVHRLLRSRWSVVRWDKRKHPMPLTQSYTRLRCQLIGLWTLNVPSSITIYE